MHNSSEIGYNREYDNRHQISGEEEPEAIRESHGQLENKEALQQDSDGHIVLAADESIGKGTKASYVRPRSRSKPRRSFEDVQKNEKTEVSDRNWMEGKFASTKHGIAKVEEAEGRHRNATKAEPQGEQGGRRGVATGQQAKAFKSNTTNIIHRNLPRGSRRPTLQPASDDQWSEHT